MRTPISLNNFPEQQWNNIMNKKIVHHGHQVCVYMGWRCSCDHSQRNLMKHLEGVNIYTCKSKPYISGKSPFLFQKTYSTLNMNEDDKIQSLRGTQSLEHGDMFSFTSRHFECEPVWHYFFSPFEFFLFVINWCCSSFAAPGLLLWSLQ